jgi:hypothetical protein
VLEDRDWTLVILSIANDVFNTEPSPRRVFRRNFECYFDKVLKTERSDPNREGLSSGGDVPRGHVK